MPSAVFDHPDVQVALRLAVLSQRNNEGQRGRHRPSNSEAALNAFSQFFKAVAAPSTSFLAACLAELHFTDVRRAAIKALRTAYLKQYPELPLVTLAAMLGCDDLDDAATICAAFGLRIDTDPTTGTLAAIIYKGIEFDGRVGFGCFE